LRATGAFPKLREEIAAVLDRAAREPVSVELTDPQTAKPFTVKLSRNADGFFLSVTCSEDVTFIKEAEIPAAVAGTFLGYFRIRQQQAACEGCPVAPARFRVEGLPGIVLVFERKDGPAGSLTMSQPGRPDLVAVRKP
jgi:hypothetical protein